MSEFQASNFKKENGGTPDLLGKTELTSPYFFVPPSGDTASRPVNCTPGTLRFNTDIGTLEVYRGDTIGWVQIVKRENQYLGGGTGSNIGVGTRGLFGLGFISPTGTNQINFVTVSTLGNSQDFGDLTAIRSGLGAMSSPTRTVFAGGSIFPSHVNTLDKIEILTTGNAVDFGDITGDSGEVFNTNTTSNGHGGL